MTCLCIWITSWVCERQPIHVDFDSLLGFQITSPCIWIAFWDWGWHPQSPVNNPINLDNTLTLQMTFQIPTWYPCRFGSHPETADDIPMYLDHILRHHMTSLCNGITSWVSRWHPWPHNKSLPDIRVDLNHTLGVCIPFMWIWITFSVSE